MLWLLPIGMVGLAFGSTHPTFFSVSIPDIPDQLSTLSLLG